MGKPIRKHPLPQPARKLPDATPDTTATPTGGDSNGGGGRHLRLVPPTPPTPATPPQSNQPASPTAFLLSIALFGAALATTMYYASQEMSVVPKRLQRFTELESVLRDRGTDRFLQEKAALRTDVSTTLQTGNPAERIAAESIAVYLYPDLLPSDDFERLTAEELWTPLQSALERATREDPRRAWFEEMRANVWIYENPSRTQPQLTPIARHVLAIYDALSDAP